MKRNVWKGLVVVLALAALSVGGCEKKAAPAGQPADSLTLLPSSGSPAALSDTVAAAAPAPTPAAAAPTPPPARAKQPSERTARKTAPTAARPSGPASYTAAAGTRVGLEAADTISSRTAKAGQEFTATVGNDVTDAAGHVVIPAGSKVTGTITEVKPGGASNAGTLTLAVNSVTVHGTSYPVDATVASAATIQQGRGVTGKDVAKVGAGAAAGAIAGRILGKNAKGTIIGGALGAAAGAGVAHATRTVDVVLPKGAAVEIVLSKPVTVPAR